MGQTLTPQMRADRAFLGPARQGLESLDSSEGSTAEGNEGGGTASPAPWFEGPAEDTESAESFEGKGLCPGAPYR